MSHFPNINQLERSASAGSVIRTNGSNVPEYLAPGINGQILTVVAGTPTWSTLSFPSEFEAHPNQAAFPVTGSTDSIYYSTADNAFFIWDGAVYVQVPTPTSFTVTVAGNSGPNQTIVNGDTLSLLASRGFTVVMSATDTATITPPAGSATGQYLRWDNGTSTWSAGTIAGTEVTNTPAGNISSTDVQSAINELDSEKQVNIQFQDEGVNLGTSGTVDTVNVTGAGVTASRAGNTVTINVPAGAGEANTASNVNVGGVGVFKQKTGVDLEFRGINTTNAGIGVALDGANNEIDLTLVAGTTAGNVISVDGTGVVAIPVTEYFSPADGSTTLTLANTPKAGTVVKVFRNGLIEIPVTDWSIAGTLITVTTAYNPSLGGAANSQKAHVDYWI